MKLDAQLKLGATLAIRLPEKRARQLLMLSEGAVMMMLVHRDRRYVEAAAEAAKQLVTKRR